VDKAGRAWYNRAMKRIEIIRDKSCEWGTPGSLSTDGFSCKTLELPWADNHRHISCIPVGSYYAVLTASAKFGRCYLLQSVPGRDSILIHAGNFAGNTGQNYRSDVEGCILLGDGYGILDNGRGREQFAILNSRKTLAAFHAATAGEPLIVKIMGA
jgi:hypothetical protein